MWHLLAEFVSPQQRSARGALRTETQESATKEKVAGKSAAGEEIIDYSNFASVITGEGDWIAAGFPLEDGGFWKYQEPAAVVIIQDGFLRVAAVPYTRHHDAVQI